MSAAYEIRAHYTKSTITIYQAYAPAIADPAIKQQKFVAPFSFQRMTWIKPSFRWLMHRSNWGQKKSQDRILAVEITRSGWDKALELGVLTHPEPSVYPDPDAWTRRFQEAAVHIQWDTERNFRGAGLSHFSIQVGISRRLIQEYVDQWIVKVEDLTPKVIKMRDLIRSGKANDAKRMLPSERVYQVEPAIARRLMLTN